MKAQHILVFNAGSSSIRYAVYDMADHRVIVSGAQEGIGAPMARWRHLDHHSAGGEIASVSEAAVSDHAQGFRFIVDRLMDSEHNEIVTGLEGIGHRVVH